VFDGVFCGFCGHGRMEEPDNNRDDAFEYMYTHGIA